LFVQPKLDGNRAYLTTENGTPTALALPAMYSRTGKKWEHVDHIIDDFKKISENYVRVLDGELYSTEIPFNQLNGLIKKKVLNENDAKLLLKVKFHVFDIIDEIYHLTKDLIYYKKLKVTT